MLAICKDIFSVLGLHPPYPNSLSDEPRLGILSEEPGAQPLLFKKLYPKPKLTERGQRGRKIHLPCSCRGPEMPTAAVPQGRLRFGKDVGGS